MDAKAMIQLDGQELTLLINASIKRSKISTVRISWFSERYDLQKEEKPALES